MEKLSIISESTKIKTPIENASILEYELDKETKL